MLNRIRLSFLTLVVTAFAFAPSFFSAGSASDLAGTQAISGDPLDGFVLESRQERAQAERPIRLDALLEALRIGGFSNKELIRRVQVRGVDFIVTSEVESKLLRLGASRALIAAAKVSYKPRDQESETDPRTPRGFASPITTDWERDELRGKVKSISTWSASLVNQFGKWVEKDKRLSTVYDYSPNGRRLFFKGFLVGIEVELLNGTESGNKLDVDLLDDFAGDLEAGRWVFKYDPQGRLSGWAVLDPSGVLKKKITQLFDSASRQNEVSCYNGDGSLYRRYTISFDGAGRIKEKALYDSNGEILEGNNRTMYEYDSFGRLIMQRVYSSSRRLFRTETTSYDREGRKVSNTIEFSRQADGKGKAYSKIIIGYDANGNPSETRYFDLDGNLAERLLESYDPEGNQLEYMDYDAGNTIKEAYRYDYQFDKNHNWVRVTSRKMVTKFGRVQYEPISVEHREISYY